MRMAGQLVTLLHRRAVLAMAVALLLAAGTWAIAGLDGRNRVSALFDTGVGVYQGSEVRVLGVGVGSVAGVRPEGRYVRVDMDIDDSVKIPADAQALVIAPSMVADRYIQLSPPYTGGPTMPAGTTIPRQRTATPVELDELLASANELTTALGPRGANADGSLSRLLDVGAANLQGNGRALNDTLVRLSELTETLSENRGDFFTSVDNLRTFVSTLAESDAQVRQLTANLADMVGFLGTEKDQLGAGLRDLAVALNDVKGFVRTNRGLIKSNVDKLTQATRALVDQRAALNEILAVSPTTLNNLLNIYDAQSGTGAARANFNELSQPPILTICGLIRQHRPDPLPKTLADVCGNVASALQDVASLPSAAELMSAAQRGELPPLPLVEILGGSR